MDENTTPRVFISYTHDTLAHKKKVLDLSDFLIAELGIDCWIDQYVEGSSPERGWPMWMEENIRVADYVLVVCTETYLKRFEGREEEKKGLGAKFESILLAQHLYDGSASNKKIIPVVLNEEDEAFIPIPLRPYTYYNLSKEGDLENFYRRITNQIRIKRPEIGKIKVYDSGINLIKENTDTKSVLSSDVHQKEEYQLEPEFPELPEITESMKSGLKIVQAFFMLPVTKRFSIAAKLGLLESGESYTSRNTEEISSQILIRAKSREVMADLWSELFDENIDPNPFK